MSGNEPIFRENVLTGADAWRHIFELDPHQQRVLGQMSWSRIRVVVR